MSNVLIEQNASARENHVLLPAAAPASQVVVHKAEVLKARPRTTSVCPQDEVAKRHASSSVVEAVVTQFSSSNLKAVLKQGSNEAACRRVSH